MLQRRVIAFCIGLLCFIAASGQVNMQTGSGTFSLPIFNWQEDKSRLKMDVVLAYNSGNGMRVSEIASSVGQGWNLMAGGVISRMTIGEPDDQQEYGNNNDHHDLTKFPAGYLHTNRAPGDGCPLAMTKYPIYGGKNEKYRQHNAVAADKQLDYFSFQYNGKAGMFVLDPVQGNRCASLGDTKIKISFEQDQNLKNHGIRTTITSFTIQDVDGMIYRFKNHGLSKVLEAKYCDRNLKQTQTQPNFKSRGVYHQASFENSDIVRPWVINNWYLTEIEEAFTHRKILFNYSAPETLAVEGGSDVSYDSWHNYTIVTHKNSIEQVPILASIDYPDGHKAIFKYGKDRLDMPNDKALTAIDITYTTPNRQNLPETRYLSRHQINTSYFILNRYGTPVTDYEKKVARLCLRSVKKIGPDLKEDSPPYSFDYFMGSGSGDDIIPPRATISHDIWGYYNGYNTTTFFNTPLQPTSSIATLEFDELRGLCYLRDGGNGTVFTAKAGLAKNGLLKQIIYPTGGTLSYEYAQNTGVVNGSTATIGGVHVSKTSSTDGGYSNNCNNPIVTNYNYVSQSGASSLWGIEAPDNVGDMSMYYAPEKRNYRWSLGKCHGGIYGCCYWAYQYPGIMSQTTALNLNGFQKFMISAEPVMGYLSAVMTVVDIVMLATSTAGGPPGLIVAAVIDVISSYLELGLSCNSDDSKEGTSTSYYSFDMNGINPLPMQFKRVEVIEGSGANGKTVHDFTSDVDYPIWQLTNTNQTIRQRFAPWSYGLPKLTTVLDVNNKKVSQTEYKYNWEQSKRMIEPLAQGTPLPAHQIASSLVNCKCLVQKNVSQRYTDWEQPQKYNADYQLNTVPGVLGVEFYPLFTGRTELETKTERVYDKVDDTRFVQTVTSYFYNGSNGNNGQSLQNYELARVYITKSDGYTTTERRINYSSDFSGGVFDVLNANNVIAEPLVVSEILWWGEYSMIDQKVAEYIQLPGGSIRPSQTLQQKLPNSGAYQGLTTDYSKMRITETYSYDAAGNMVTAKDEGGRKVANVYGYNDKHIIATVENADAADDKPAYTSFETNAFGGWQIAATAAFDLNNAVTGTASLNLSGNSCSANLNTLKPYILSFWANSSNVMVSGGATLLNSTPVINGFTYYEYHIAVGTASVTVSGNALIDELRLYPQTARMLTTTYDPVIGKTSECDENNRITYYEYDDLGRLKFIKDAHRNILKMYEYNNVLQQNGCPGVYYNSQITEVFTKSNCIGDYIGGEVNFTIPANKYTSTASQEDADAQAEMELMEKGQQKANAEGQCIPLYYNAALSVSFTKTNCPDGYAGGTLTYTVPARKYSSTIAGKADDMAWDEVNANGQANANANQALCSIDTEPNWEVIQDVPTECRQVDGQGHLFVYVKDINPNSSSYNSLRWHDNGPDGNCPSGPYYSDDASGYYAPTNCPPGWSGYTSYITMPAGAFVSNISKQDANNQAYAEAQARANRLYKCEGPATYVDVSSISRWWGDNAQFEVVFTHAYTGERYYFYGSGYGIPEGPYDVYFSASGSSYSDHYDLTMCGFTAHGPWNWLNSNQVYISEYGCNSFSISAHQH